MVKLEAAPAGDSEWIAWWFCGLYKPQVPGTQPKVLVEFRRLLNDGTIDNSRNGAILSRLPLSELGQVRVGTSWKGQQCDRELVLEEKLFDLDFTPGSWRITCPFDETKVGGSEPFPLQLHPLKYGVNDRNRLLEFSLPTGERLVVPCLEFFARCYGRGSNLRRDLATYPWDGHGETCVERLYAPLEEPDEPDMAWKIRPRGGFVRGDTVFLAHAKYDPYTESVARRIYAELEADFSNRPTSPAFLNVRPWFQGPARLLVAGRPFEGGFLGLRILGCSEPSGILIERLRDAGEPDETLPEANELSDEWRGAEGRRLVKAPQIVHLVDEDPDRNARSIQIDDPDFIVLGERRPVRMARRGGRSKRKGPSNDEIDVEGYSGGQRHGSGKAVGHYTLNTPSVMESHGAMRDMWNAMQHLGRKYPEAISSVSWFTFQTGFRYDRNVSTIALSPFEPGEPAEPEIRHWLFLDRQVGIPRGVLVARMNVRDRRIDFFEIQRRPRTKKDKNDRPTAGEENFQGLACQLRANDDHEAWVRTFLSRVRHVKGVVKKLVRECPGKAVAFIHKSARDEEVPCEAAILRTLQNLDLHLDEPGTK
ncbi:hypothetical protein [Labrys miyagiensis]